jgi:hypothetical protein
MAADLQVPAPPATPRRARVDPARRGVAGGAGTGRSAAMGGS